MTILRIGIASQQEIRKRALDIAAGRRTPSSDDPKVWFESLESLAKVLSEENRAILKTIRENHPNSVSTLADLVGRSQGNLSRTLKKMEQFGIVELRKEGRTTVPVAPYDQIDLKVHA